MPWQLIPAARLEEHAAAWDALQRQSTNTPFLESAFLLPLLREFGSGSEFLGLHTESGSPNAAAIVVPAGRGMWQTFQPSQLPLGPWLTHPGADLPALLSGLVGALPGVAIGLGLTQLDPKLTPRPQDGRQLRTLDYIHTSHVDIAGTFDEYWAARGKNLRQNTKKQHNKLEGEGVVPRLECVDTPEGVEDALRDYGVLETGGWKAGTGTAIHLDNAQGRFYASMLQRFCAQGRARLYRYRFGDQVVAMDLCIDNGPTVVILKTAYDESHRAVSPSTLMRQQQFRAWWDEGRYRRIEFYGKTLEWHTRWTESGRMLYHATFYRWPLVADMAAFVARRRTAAA